jgi:hypothetical protein
MTPESGIITKGLETLHGSVCSELRPRVSSSEQASGKESCAINSRSDDTAEDRSLSLPDGLTQDSSTF